MAVEGVEKMGGFQQNAHPFRLPWIGFEDGDHENGLLYPPVLATVEADI